MTITRSATLVTSSSHFHVHILNMPLDIVLVGEYFSAIGILTS